MYLVAFSVSVSLDDLMPLNLGVFLDRGHIRSQLIIPKLLRRVFVLFQDLLLLLPVALLGLFLGDEVTVETARLYSDLLGGRTNVKHLPFDGSLLHKVLAPQQAHLLPEVELRIVSFMAIELVLASLFLDLANVVQPIGDSLHLE